MEKNKDLRFQRYKIISGSTLKLIAVFTMLIDHIGAYILSSVPSEQQVILSLLGRNITLCAVCRLIGRTAFPIYAFLITEGYIHTRNKFKYGRNLLIFALVSEIPWNYVHTLTFRYGSQNVYFTLFFGYLGICFFEKFKDNKPVQILSLFVLLLVAYCFSADYGIRGVALIMVLYYLRNQRILRFAVGIGISSSSIKTTPAYLLISLYNGKRGFIKSKYLKYAFYAFYPVHLLILGYLRKKYFV
ncbi:MAG: conjugal transfer protein TraX [Clostridia bacterium]|nr:conjugal transfer protein TraX [Clostridia bacterium]